jgi:hypothetical protein
VHGIIDFVSAGAALMLPRFLNCSDRLKNAVTMMALGKLAYGLMTRHELGLVRKIPMKTHLVLDTIAGASMAALPFMLEEEEPEAITACVALGMMDVAVAPLTQTTSTVEPWQEISPGHFRSVSPGRSPVVAS